LAVAKQSEAISLVEIAAESPRRIHQVLEANVSSTPDRVALVEARASWTYLELDRSVTDIAAALKSLGVRAGDRMIIVSENCIALAALLLAASRIDGADCNVNRQSPQAQTRGVPAERVSRPASAGPMQ
jgi:long-chain acyl-CoA synthetase